MTDSLPPTATPASLGYETPHVLQAGFPTVLGMAGLRLLGIYLIVLATVSLPTLIYFFAGRAGSASGTDVLLYLTVPLAHLATGLFLALNAQRLALRLFPSSSQDGGSIQRFEMFPMIIACVGILVFATSLSPLVYAMGAILRPIVSFMARPASGLALDGPKVGSLVTAMIQPAFGIYLFFCANRVARFGRRYVNRA